MAPSPYCTVLLKQYKPNSSSTVNLKFNALIDTGSTHSYLHKKLLNPDLILEDVNYTVGNITQDNILIIRKRIKCNIIIADGSEITNCTLCVIEDDSADVDGIIGMDLISNNTLKSSELFIQHQSSNLKNLSLQKHQEDDQILNVTTLRKTKNTAYGSVDLKNAALLHPNEQKRVKVTKFNGKELKQVDETLFKNWVVLAAPVEKANDIDHVTLLNKGHSALIIEAGTTILKHAQKMENPENGKRDKILNFLISKAELAPAEKITFKKELQKWKEKRNELVEKVSIDDEITEAVQTAPADMRQELQRILAKFSWFFSRNQSDAGLNQHWAMDLCLKEENTSPVFSRPYKIDASLLKQIEEKLAQMCESGIIEPANSSWNSPLLTVVKKDKSIRIVNNYSAKTKNGSVNTNLKLPRVSAFASTNNFGKN
ncbi:unnamed protein product [Oikopleura dioica]|uniref:Peptidase A2 domain-containing protein n=1 Tax=Oikopleura dioica TaxID=34765 RepID=E4X2E2_OIKDI|nr:unnamed protein product [Oikopleura dioica]